MKQFELERSFQVLVFLGSVPEEPNQWESAPSYVGSFSAFVNGAAAQCANCQANLDLITEGYVHLEDAIARHNTSDYPFNPDHVKPYLKNALNWRVQMVSALIQCWRDHGLTPDIMCRRMEHRLLWSACLLSR